eukprot:7869844-Karenia_brevis.AAC.1
MECCLNSTPNIPLSEEMASCVKLWGRAILICLSWNYYGRSAWPSFNDATALKDSQKSAVRSLMVRVREYVNDNNMVFEKVNFEEDLNLRKIGYNGEEQYHAEVLTWEQIEPALPPENLAGSVAAESMCEGFVKDCLLDPSLLLKEEEEVPELPKPPSVWVEDQEWSSMAVALVKRKIFGVLEESEVALFKNKLMLHGLIGVAKRGRPEVSAGKAVLRLVMNLAATNVCFDAIEGDMPTLPTTGQWQ